MPALRPYSNEKIKKNVVLEQKKSYWRANEENNNNNARASCACGETMTQDSL